MREALVEAKLNVEVGKVCGYALADPLTARVDELLVRRPLAARLMQRLFEESGRGRKVGERQRHGLDRQAAPLRGERDGDFQKDRRLPALRVHLYEALFKVAQLVVRLVTCHRACNLVAEGLEHAVARRERRALGHTHVRLSLIHI